MPAILSTGLSCFLLSIIVIAISNLPKGPYSYYGKLLYATGQAILMISFVLIISGVLILIIEI